MKGVAGPIVTIISALLALVLIGGFFVAVLAGDEEQRREEEETNPGLPLDPGELPEGVSEWVQKAGQVCPEVSATLVAAIGRTESNWRTDLTSWAGAVGPMQFMPATWAAFGRDADGDGVADPRSIPDAVVSGAHLLCDNVDILEGAGLKASVDHLAASYNAGPYAVIQHGGVPPFAETVDYVHKVKEAMKDYSGSPEDPVPNPGSAAVIAAAQGYHGTPYAWSGGDYSGPTEGSPREGKGGEWDGTGIIGFDCSGLMEFAFFKGTNGKVRLPSNTRLQVQVGQPVPMESIRAGDMVFFDDPQTGRVFHVALYVGDGKFVHAPSPGRVVTTEKILESPFWARANPQARRVL